MAITGAVLVGNKELKKELRKWKIERSEEVSDIFHKQAERFRDAVKIAAPGGILGTIAKATEAGRYKRATLKSRGIQGVGSYVRIDYKKAPFATTLEYGGGKIEAKSYFRTTWDKMRRSMSNQQTRDLGKLIKEDAKEISKRVKRSSRRFF